MASTVRPEALPGPVEADLRRLVDDYRRRCLWFLRADYYPHARSLTLLSGGA